MAGPTSEEYSFNLATTPSSTNLVEQTLSETIQSSQFVQNFSNIGHLKNQVSTSSNCFNSNSDICPVTISKTISSLNSYNNSSEFSSNCSDFSYSTLNFTSNSNFSSGKHLNNISNNNIFEDIPDSSAVFKNLYKNRQVSSILFQEDVKSISKEQSSLYNCPKVAKTNSNSNSKPNSNQINFLNSFNSHFKNKQEQDSADLSTESFSKTKKDHDVNIWPSKFLKEDDPEINVNIEDWQHFISKHLTKIKQNSESNQDILTDSFLQFLQKKTEEKNCQDSIIYEGGETDQLSISLTNKNKSEEQTIFKKKEFIEESKLMNDFISKILLEKEEKKFKFSDERKKSIRKEILDDFNNDLDEKIKRDAMSQYQEDKTHHHKRSSNYNDLNQWEFLNQQGIQNPGNHPRRGPFSFGGSSQAHSLGWNPVGMGMPRQTNPYYSNPHSNMMPAHAHTEYRYNQWNASNQKNLPNIHNAHSQNTILPQSRLDIKHHSDIFNSMSEYAMAGGATTDLSKLRNSPRDLMIRSQSTDKSSKSGIHSDHRNTISPTIKNSTVRPSLSAHQKTVISNPLSDLQMLVTNQKNDNQPLKSDSYQQESVDLSAHSDLSKSKESAVKKENASASENNTDQKECNPPISLKTIRNQIEISEKPVKLVSKNSEKCTESEISSSSRINNIEKNDLSSLNSKDRINTNISKNIAESIKNAEVCKETSVIVEKSKNLTVSSVRNKEGIPKNLEIITINPSSNEKELKSCIVEELPNDSESKMKTMEPDEKKEEILKIENSKNEITIKTSEKCETADSEKITNGKRKAADEDSGGTTNKRTVLEVVESQLVEKTIESNEDNPDLPTVTSTSAEVKTPNSETLKKTPKKKPSKKSKSFRVSSAQSSSSDSQFFNKKFRTSLTKDDNKKKLKKSFNDSMDRRGPILHLEGSRDSPSSVTVINFPKGDDEDEKDKSTLKKQTLSLSRPKHLNELDYRGD